MIRLTLSDLVTHGRVWLGILALTTATGFVGAIAAGLIETGLAYGGRVLEALSSTSSAVILFTVIAALIVLSSAANLTVALHQRSYALWQLVGIRPSLVAGVVLSQLGIVGAVGSLAGCLVASPVFPHLFAWVFRQWLSLQGITPQFGVSSTLLVMAVVTVLVVLGGLRGARRASRTPPIEALRDPEPPRVTLGWFRIVLTALTLAGTFSLVMSLDGSESLSALAGKAILLTPLLASAIAAAGPWMFPLVLRAWTSLLPARMSGSWFLARHSARYRLSQSNAAISPLMFAIALSGGLYTMAGTLDLAMVQRDGSAGNTGLTIEGVVILLGGPLLISAVAAAATVFMSGRAREREFALIQAAGSTRGTIVLTAIWEGVIYTVTATILGTLATVVGGVIIAAKLSLPHPAISFSSIALIAGGGFVLILSATVAPTISALRHEIPRMLAVE